jgi:FkbM family methyltransferase
MRAVFESLLGEFIRLSGKGTFPGKNSRLIPWWMALRNQHSVKVRTLPGGGKVFCDLSIPYECMVWLKQEEQEELKVLRQLLKPQDIFVDCGANIGLWSLVAAATVGRSGRVFAFEPNPMTFSKLGGNLALSGYSNVRIMPAAVGGVAGKAILQTENAHNISRIVEESGKGTVEVSLVTLDSALAGEKINGCKLDVEGSELAALKGAAEILKTYKPWLCVEFNTTFSEIPNLSQWEVHKFLCQFGYVPRLFRDALDSTTTTILPDDFKISGYCNLFYAVPKS